jgi:two-component system response regulator MtrA
MMAHVMVVEDDDSIRESVGLALSEAGYRITLVGDGTEAIRRARDDPPDLIVLDLMLPGRSGIDVCSTIRNQSTIPIIMLTAKTESSDIVAGLECGADDYVTKPFDLEELMARVRAALRRSHIDYGDQPIRLGDLVIQPSSFRAYRGPRQLPLTTTEFRLLTELAIRGGQVISRVDLLHTVWNYDYLGDSRLVDQAIKRLRAKVEDNPAEPTLIVTVRGVGYRLETP